MFPSTSGGNKLNDTSMSHVSVVGAVNTYAALSERTAGELNTQLRGRDLTDCRYLWPSADQSVNLNHH